MRFVVLVALLGAPCAAQAQPYSDSMADCAALYQNSAQFVSDDRADMFHYAMRQWHTAAVKQSAKEGRPLTEKQMWEKVNAQSQKWEQNGAMFIFSQEFRDWSAYCKSFARHIDVTYTLPRDQ